MKRITVRRVVVAAILLASLLLPTLRLATGSSLADLQLSTGTVWACENPDPAGGCGGG